MRNKIAVMFLLIMISAVFQGCIFQKEVKTSSSELSSSTESMINTDYEPLEINDDGKIKRGSDFVSYELDELILLLREKNIPIIEVKGAGKAFIDDGGNVRFEDTDWEYELLEKIDSPYDVGSLMDLFRVYKLKAGYVQTPYEIFTFMDGAMPDVYPWPDINVIIITNPRFVTEEGIKIGDSFETAAEAYRFRDEDILKESDLDWRVWALFPNFMVRFVGLKDGISSIELGHFPPCVD